MKLPRATIVFSLAMAIAVQLVDAQVELRLRLETPTRGTLAIKPKPTATVSHLKWLVEESEGIKRDRQVLLCGDQVLSDDERLLSDYNLEDNSRVIVTLLPSSAKSLAGVPSKLTNYKIKVYYKSKLFDIEMEPAYTFAAVKDEISRRTGVPYSRQVLMFKGRILEDSDLIYDEPDERGVRPGSTVYLFVARQ